MTLRPSELLQVATELAGSLAGRPLQKVVAAGAHGVALGFPAAWLLVSVDRRFGRIHLLDGKPPGSGDAAPPFVMLLRKELVGLRFLGVEAVAGERAVALDFGRGEARRRLLVFLYGAGPRLILVDDHPAQEGEAALLGAFPPASAGAPPPRTSLKADKPPARLEPDEGRGGAPVVDRRGADEPSRFPDATPSAAIAARYGLDEEAARVAQTRAALLADARRTLERVRRREQALEGDLARLEPAAARRRHADLLLAHLAEVPRGAAEVTLPDDFEEGAPVRIPLDPALSAQENARRLYHQHRRLARGRAAVEQRLASTRAERLQAEQRVALVEGGSPERLGGLALTRARPTGRSGGRDGRSDPGRDARRGDGQRPVRPARAQPYRTFRSASGAAILVGKGAERNDELTFHVARGNDLWLHARDFPGAHVVVPLSGRPVDEQTLLDAATLALWFSPARPDRGELPTPTSPAAALLPGQAVQADVTYALRKLVRKPRGAAPGRVSIAGGKTIRIRLEPARLERLLHSQELPDTDSPSRG